MRTVNSLRNVESPVGRQTLRYLQTYFMGSLRAFAHTVLEQLYTFVASV